MYLFAFFLVLYEFTTYSANDMIMPGMVQVIQDFQASQIYVALSLSLYILGNCLFLLTAGFMSERYGKRRIILVGNLLFLIFTILIIYSQNIHQFMLLRVMQGSGMSIIAIGYAIIHAHFNDKNAIKIAALMANISILAPLLGPVIGSMIVSQYSWEYVFILTALLSILTLFGLYKTAPEEPPSITTTSFITLAKEYFSIIRNREFLSGVACSVLLVMVLLLWIGQAPNLILLTLKLDYFHYAIYQLITMTGLILSSLLMQYIVGKFSLYHIVKVGNGLLLLGLLIGLVGGNYIAAITIGLSIYALGMGLANGCIMRLIMTVKGHAPGMVAAMFAFLQALSFAIVLTLMNEYYHYFQYSLLSFTYSSLAIGILAFICVARFIKPYRTRPWL